MLRVLFVTISVFATLLLGVALVRAASADSATQNDSVTGLWYTQDKDGGIELYSCGDNQICGRFYWLKDNAKENISRDTQNPDRDKRDRPLCHMQFMGGFTPDGDGHYADGWIYSPRHGEVFRATMTLVDHETLDLHGYVLTPLLGESQIWKRTKALPACVAN